MSQTEFIEQKGFIGQAEVVEQAELVVAEDASVRSQQPVLTVRGLRVSFRQRGSRAAVRVLDRVDLTVRPGEIVGVIGETGSGKTTLARAVVGLVDTESGTIEVNGQSQTGQRRRARRAWRRSGAVQFVFQDPLRSLDPDLTVGKIVSEGLAIAGVSRDERRRRVALALERVGLDADFVDRTPGQLSGGQRQRVSIARAIISEPRLLICDEPVSALDASNRNHILRLISQLRDELGLGVLLISHDLSSLAGIADKVAVLYRGTVVEQGPIGAVFTSPQHPYTALLVASAPSVDRPGELVPAALRQAPAAVSATPGGCVFAHRCPAATEVCATAPTVTAVDTDWSVACHHTSTWRTNLPIAHAHSDISETPPSASSKGPQS